MRVLTIGGHGKVARILSNVLSARGHDVTAVIRNPAHSSDVEEDGATALVADVESMTTAELTDLIRDHDAVVWSAGAGGGDPKRTYAVDRDAAIRSMDAAVAAGVTRYVMVSYFGAGPDHGVPENDGFFAYAEAKTAADAHLVDSGLDWTLVRPSRLTDDRGTGRIETPRTGADKGAVPRSDVALVVADVLDRPDTVGLVLEFNEGDTPIADELDALTAG